MYYKRNESYRFVFKQPIEGKLTKHEGNNTVTTNVTIIDISYYGAKIYCNNAIELKKDTRVSLAFKLNSTPFRATGNIIWMKEFPESAKIGVHLNTDDAYRNDMARELKAIARNEKM